MQRQDVASTLSRRCINFILFGAADVLVYALVIIFGQLSSLFDQMHTTLDVGVIRVIGCIRHYTEYSEYSD